MDDARRYRVYAADCLLAAKTCHPGYRSMLVSIATSWHSLACQEEAIDLLRIFEASPTRTISATRNPMIRVPCPTSSV
jgi:hypothetical protein